MTTFGDARSLEVYVGADHASHAPGIDLSDGPPGFAHPERPERLPRVLAGLERRGAAFLRVRGWGADALAAVEALHEPDYLDFLETACAAARHGGGDLLPLVFDGASPTAPPAARAGRFCREIGTPITPAARDAGLNAVAAVLAAADAFLLRLRSDAEASGVVAAVRPPGHHAAPRRYGGYCYFNNAVAAAAALEARDLRVGILDIDYHLGDGTLEYASPSRPYASMHVDPLRNYPLLTEAAARERRGARFVVLPPGAGDQEIIRAAFELVAFLNAAALDAVVLSLGFDLNRHDPIHDAPTRFDPADFAALGAAVAGLGSPVLTVLEGGYDLARLPLCAEAFFAGFAPDR